MIDQAKGMMMAIYRIDADTAYRLLRWRSQNVNVKLRALAGQIVKDFSEMAFDDTLPQRAEYDHLLMTAHNRASVATDSSKKLRSDQ